ncbi:PLP-dependent cysteine synthase family protein [Hippea jasoniae]|uniref:PLP-dependent cysteine synthase family protein n=1 Tax=Hippea jasoniae TaxID=944479 RepID=UPI000553116A|nr:cysteine synthase family protein [Hippea jasoniae]
MNVVDTIGNTPLIKLKNGIFAKLEYFNPTGSIKDRTAWGMLSDAMKKGSLNRAKGIVEPTSGNTGISLAFLGAYFNIPVKIVMPENMSRMRIRMMESFGAEVILTDAKKGMSGSIEVAEQLQKEGFLFLNQFSNPANPAIHYETTADEIISAIEVDIFICGIGTGGTFSGVAKRLKEINPSCMCVAVEPEGSAYLSRGVKGLHKIQGLGAGFKPDVLDESLIDEIVAVGDDEALANFDELSKDEGIFAGISSGAVYGVAKEFKKRYSDKNILIIFPDSKDRYMEL